jgi:lipoprotein-releasing system ATP-binding protein
MASSPELVVADVTKEYPTRAEPLRVLRGVSCELGRGESLAILGPSGCGKSTLLHIIGTLDSPTSGRVTLGGQDPFALDERRLAAFRNHKIGFIFQDHHLLPQCSALENVLLPTLANGKPPQHAVERAEMLLDRVGLADRLDHLPCELSGGERATAHGVARLLVELQALEQTMLIVVTHSQELAGTLGRQRELNDGRLK